MEGNEVAPKDFAGSPFLSAKNYKLGDKIEVKVLAYKGFQEYVSKDNEESRSSPTYEVETRPNETWQLRLNKTSVGFLYKNGIDKWEKLVGKTLVLLVNVTNKGNGFSVIDLK
jgi:hypothetical protein